MTRVLKLFRQTNIGRVCENCGAMTHDAKSCMERPRKAGAKWTSKNIAPDEKIELLSLTMMANGIDGVVMMHQHMRE